MISVRTTLYCCLLVILAAAPGYAQDTHNEKNPSKAASTASSNKSPAPAGRVIMKVGGVSVKQGEFESTIGDIEPQRDADEGEVEKDRRRLGDDYASVLMLSQLALANHLDADPAIRQKLATARLQILSDAEFALLLNRTKPSDSEVIDYYDAHLADYDRVKLRRLFIWKVGGGSKNTRGLPADEAKARAAAILQTSASGGDPTKLAQMFPQSDQGIFDEQPLTFIRGQLPAKLDKTAFSMKVGQWAEAEDTPDHTILVDLVERDRQPLPEVHALVSKLVQGEKMQQKLEQLKKKTGIWMDEQYFGRGSAVSTDPGEQRPASSAPENSGSQE